MSAINGIVFAGGVTSNEVDVLRFYQVVEKSGERGRDDTAVIVVRNDGWAFTTYDHLPAKAFFEKYSRGLGGLNELAESTHWACILACNINRPLLDRAAPTTVGIGDWAGVFDGTISNLAELGAPDIGTAILTQYEKLEKKGGRGQLLTDAVTNKLTGGFAYIAAHLQDPVEIHIVRSFRSLWMIRLGTGAIVFSSDKEALESVYGRHPQSFGPERYQEMPPYSAMVFNINQDSSHFYTYKIKSGHVSNIPSASNRKAVVVCSGGLDSCVASFVAAKIHGLQLRLVHFDYGQTASEREWEAVKTISREINQQGGVAICENHKLKPAIDSTVLQSGGTLPPDEDGVNTLLRWVPARNVMMLGYAAHVAECDGAKFIYTGFNLDEAEVFPDNTKSFFDAVNHMLKYGTLGQVQLMPALERLTKPELIRLGIHLDAPLGACWSCDTDGRGDKEFGEVAQVDGADILHCGKCAPCLIRQHAFSLVGLQDSDPISYRKPLSLEPQESVIANVPIEDIIKKIR